MSGLFSKPKTPAPLAPDDSAARAAAQQAEEDANRAGRNSTILTMFAPAAPSGAPRRTVLGGA